MPRGIILYDKNILSNFRETVVRNLPFELNQKSKFTDFSDFVYEKSGVLLSVSTLRRLMLEDIEIMPTTATLNAVAVSIGYSNFKNFVNLSEQEVEYLSLQEMSYMHHKRTSDFESFKEQIEKYRNTKVYFNVYQHMVYLALEDKNMEILPRVFEFPEIFKNQWEDIPLAFFITIFIQKVISDNLINQLIPHFAKNESSQLHLIEWFVDESNLSGYFGRMMDEYTKYRREPNDLLFYDSLMAYRNIGLNLPIHKFIEKYEILPQNTFFHFFPCSRRLALLMHYYFEVEDKFLKYKQELEDLLNSMDIKSNIRMAHFLCRIFFVCKNPNLIRFACSRVNLKKVKDVDILTRIDANEVVKYQAYVEFMEGKIKLAKETLQRYNPSFKYIYFIEISNLHYSQIKSLIES